MSKTESARSSPSLARGSTANVTSISTPRARVVTPVSAFQLPASTRESELDMMLRRPEPDNHRRYYIAVIALLLCAVAVLSFLLLL